MKIIVDNQIVKLLASSSPAILKNPYIACVDNQISFGWASLFEYLGLGSVLSALPPFDKTHPLFVATLKTLFATEKKEVILHVFDHLFTENLNQIRDLPQINAPFLIQAINERIEKTPAVLSPALQAIKSYLVKNPSHAMHDLILYLAWDRMCVWMASLFNRQANDPKFIHGLSVLRECLIESYQHIAQQGRTSPSIYRLIEALFFYQMREENLSKHTDAEWALLSQSFPALKAEDEFIDFFYIDDAVIPEDNCYMTLDSSDKVNQRLALAQYMLAKLKEEVPHWGYVLHPKKIVYLDGFLA